MIQTVLTHIFWAILISGLLLIYSNILCYFHKNILKKYNKYISNKSRGSFSEKLSPRLVRLSMSGGSAHFEVQSPTTDWKLFTSHNGNIQGILQTKIALLYNTSLYTSQLYSVITPYCFSFHKFYIFSQYACQKCTIISK